MTFGHSGIYPHWEGDDACLRVQALAGIFLALETAADTLGGTKPGDRCGMA
jgi:hypothetical protein